MIHCAIYLDRQRWKLSLYILEECGEGAEVAESLANVGCRGNDLSEALNVIHSCSHNVGLTYSNTDKRNSVIMVGLQENPSEFINTLFHEVHHVVCHISNKDGISIDSEQSAYIAGDIGEAIYNMLSMHRLLP